LFLTWQSQVRRGVSISKPRKNTSLL